MEQLAEVSIDMMTHNFAIFIYKKALNLEEILIIIIVEVIVFRFIRNRRWVLRDINALCIE